MRNVYIAIRQRKKYDTLEYYKSSLLNSSTENENFKHKVRCKAHFYDTSNKTKLTNDVNNHQ